MKNILSVLIAAALLFTLPIPAFAQGTPSQKEEVVYGILGPDGSVKNVTVVNRLNGGEITDYGNYTEVRNLTTSDPISQNGEQISIHTSANRLYYQGTLASGELPWKIEIRYFLDGREISPPDLAGKSGALEIKGLVTQNPKVSNTFYDSYALQISLQLDTKLCDNIKAESATIASAGGKKQLNYTVLPGNGADFSVTADVHDFEMDAVAINGIRLSLDLAIDDEEFTGQITQLTDAIKALDDGSGELLNGASQLSDGMKKYVDGLKAFKNGLSQLGSGINGLDAGAAALKNGLSELSKQNGALKSGSSALQQSAFDAANAQLSAMSPGLPVLTPQNYGTILANIPALAAVKAQLDGVVQFTTGLGRYTDGVAQLGVGASELANGASQLKASVSSIVSPANQLYNAGVELNSAVKKLRDGLASYKGGTEELRSKTAGMDTEIKGRIEEILDRLTGGDGKVVSFVSDKNTNVSAVQFVFKTEAIKKQETEPVKVGQPVVSSFWQKLLKLFGLGGRK